MTSKPERVIDAHVHLWDPARTDWYPYLSGGVPQVPRHGSGDPTRMSRYFGAETYAEESSRWNVEKVVNVAAATGRHSVEETLELDRRAETGGVPHAIVGGLPPAESVSEAIALLERQMAAPRFRGVRPMGGLDRPVPETAVLEALAERSLVFELMTHPDGLLPAARSLDGVDGLTVVVEHTGWPRNDSETERATWKAGMEALAGLGENVVCKLSGLAMPFASMSVASLAPWIDQAIELFGPRRCMFASNFPVDSVHGTFDDLYGAFASIVDGASREDRDRLFAGTAEHVYRLG